MPLEEAARMNAPWWGPLYESAPHGAPYERSQMATRRESGTRPVHLVTATN